MSAQFKGCPWEKRTLKKCFWSWECGMGECEVKVIRKSEETLWIELKIEGKRKISIIKDTEIKGTWTIPKIICLGTKIVQHVKNLSRKEKSISVILYFNLEDLNLQLCTKCSSINSNAVSYNLTECFSPINWMRTTPNPPRNIKLFNINWHPKVLKNHKVLRKTKSLLKIN